MKRCLLKRDTFNVIFFWCDPITRVALAFTCKALHTHLAQKREIWDWKVLSVTDGLVKAISVNETTMIDFYRRCILKDEEQFEFREKIIHACVQYGRLDLLEWVSGLIFTNPYSRLVFYAAKGKQPNMLSWLFERVRKDESDWSVQVLEGAVASMDDAWLNLCLKEYLPKLMDWESKKQLACKWTVQKRWDLVTQHLNIEKLHEQAETAILTYIESAKGLRNTMDEMFPWQENTESIFVYEEMRNAVDFNDQAMLSLIFQGLDTYNIKISNHNYVMIVKDMITNDQPLEMIAMFCTYNTDLINQTVLIACTIGKLSVVQMLKERFYQHITMWHVACAECQKHGHVYLRQYCEMQKVKII
jgi:hypothetical protein